jgi:hypothetical protein
VGIDPGGHERRRVPQVSADDDQRDAPGEHQGAARSAEIVEGGLLDTCPPQCPSGCLSGAVFPEF